jgi:divalent metal cation (Fe/Co/Zn/Cd) transporter
MVFRTDRVGRIANAYRKLTVDRRILFDLWICPAAAALGAVLGMGLAALTGWPWWIAVLGVLIPFGLWLASVIDGLRVRRRLGRLRARLP